MNPFIKKAIRAVMAGVFVLSMQSCLSDTEPADNSGGGGSEDAYIVLHVRPLNPIGSRAGEEDVEAIKSLRIIMTGEKGVEINRLFYTSVTKENPFDYIIRTKKSDKKFYLIANEEGKTVYPGPTGLKDELDKINIYTDISVLEKLYYDWAGTNQSSLLYTSYYEISAGELPEAGGRLERDFYLVPAATKFSFHFINSLGTDVTIESLSVSSIADNMFVMANLEEGEKTKTFGGKNYYWIDWLKMVADDTQANPDLPGNTEINNKYGWVSGYNIPPTTLHSEKFIINPPDEPYIILENNNSDINRYEGVPTVYLPESKYEVSGKQSYSLNISLRANSKTNNFIRELENVKALFRNTHVDVTILIKGNLEIELLIGICPWIYETIDIPTFD